MSRRIQLPLPVMQRPMGEAETAEYLVRLVSELTRQINDIRQRVDELETLQYIESDITRAPQYEGAWAIDSGSVYIGVGGAWKLVIA